MAKIGKRIKLPVVREVSAGLMLDGGDLGEILLPRGERLSGTNDEVEVFLYRDSEDRPIATERMPEVMPGEFGVLRVAASNKTGVFLDWGLAKDLLLPFREQRSSPKVGARVVVFVFLDPKSQRLIATQRIGRHFSKERPPHREGDEVSLLLFGKTDMGHKVIVDGRFEGLLFKNQVFEELFYADQRQGFVRQVRSDRKMDISLYAPGRAGVEDLEERLEKELESRGGYWELNDQSSAETIQDELGISKKAFKKALGALYRKRKIVLEEDGIRWVD